MDEARFGLKSWHRRRWCPKGFRPPWVHQDKYEWLWLYVAVEPATGESFCLYLPRLDGECFEIFLRELNRAYPGEAVMVLDGAPGHKSGQVSWPENVEAMMLPPYSPELNPVERYFQELRARLSNKVFDTIDQIMEALSEALAPYWEEPTKLASLTGYGWWLQSLPGMQTSS